MKRLTSMLLALCMVFAWMPMAAFAAGSGTNPTEIWVNGVDILRDSDKTLECGGGTADYEESSNTLILNSAAITAREGREGAGIYANGDLKIVLHGSSFIDSSVVSESGEAVSVGVKADGALNISGSGSLHVDTEFAAFVSERDMTFAGGVITASSALSNAFYARASLGISGGDIIAVSNNYPALWADTNLTITGGKVNAASSGSNGMGAGGSLSIGGAADVTAEGFYPGLFANDGISISGGKVDATGTDDSGIFTNETLSISGTSDVTAMGGRYCGLQAGGAITISGGKVNAASPNDSAIYTPDSITVTGSPEITAEGYLRALQTADLDISGGTINATSMGESAITATEKLSITGNANVIANGKVCALLAANVMILSAKNIEAYSETNYAVSNVTKDKDIIIGGKLMAESQNVYAIRSFGGIITDSNADISAKGGWGGIQADGDITFNGSKIEADGKDDDGVYSTGVISINGGSVHAKGGAGYAAIRAKSVQTAGEAAASKIELSNLVEKNGGKVAFMDWFVSDTEAKSFTTFIGKDDTTLNTSMSNALREIWLAAPYTVTFDVNGGDGDHFTEKVYPNNKVTKPADPTRSGGYIFSGWFNGDTAFDFTATTISEDLTLTANWHAHTYGEGWKSDATNHWHECTADDGAKNDVAAHEAGGWMIDKEATETEKGRQHRECTVCQYVMETEEIPVIPPQHTHTPSAEWTADANHHWQECSCGEHINAAVHNYGEWTEIKSATETEKGSKERICSACGYKEIADIPAAEKPDSPQTGGSSNISLWAALLLVSGGAFTGTVAIGKKKRRFEEEK